MRYKHYWKQIILVILIILTGIILYKIKEYQEQAFIKACLDQCLYDIYHYMTQENSRLYFGQYELSIGETKTSLLTMFYNDYIINKLYIKTYLENLNWKEIIVLNKENIITYVRKDYINYIKEQENLYIFNLLKNTPIQELKERIFNILQTYYESLSVKPNVDVDIINMLIRNILDHVNWHFYILTVECQNETYLTLLEIFYDKILFIMDIKENETFDNNALNKLVFNFMISMGITALKFTMKNLAYKVSKIPKRILLNENTFNTFMKSIRIILKYLK